MMKTLRPFVFALAAIALPLSTAAAQGEFAVGTKVLSVGLLSDGGTGVNGAFEYSLLELAPNMRLGVGASVGYFSESSFGFSFSTMPIMANGNVHLALPDVPALDLFAGAAFGIARFSYDTGFPGVDGSDSETIFGVNVGARYYFTPRIGAVAQLGLADAPELFLGVSFKF